MCMVATRFWFQSAMALIGVLAAVIHPAYRRGIKTGSSILRTLAENALISPRFDDRAER